MDPTPDPPADLPPPLQPSVKREITEIAPPRKKSHQSNFIGAFFRLLIFLAILTGLAVAGWEKPFKQYFTRLSGDEAVSNAGELIIAVPTTIQIPGVSGTTKSTSTDWLWDPNRKSRLDEKPK